MLFAYAYFTNAMMQFWEITARVALQVNWALSFNGWFQKKFFFASSFSHES